MQSMNVTSSICDEIGEGCTVYFFRLRLDTSRFLSALEWYCMITKTSPVVLYRRYINFVHVTQFW